MVSVAEAEKIILSHLFTPSTEKVDLVCANGRTLAEDVKADRDLPPFDRATMDGVAIAFSSFDTSQRKFKLEATQAAGQPQQSLSSESNGIEIMTGAPLPVGTDTVIQYEMLSIENKEATINEPRIEKFQNVHKQGTDALRDDILLTKGFLLSSPEIALLASVGKSQVIVYKNPTAAVISTGDELIEVDQTPLPHQIRKSNSFALAASLNDMGCRADAFHLRDNPEELTKELKVILEKYEVIIVSGGVSKGKFDYIPQVLELLGVKKLFHGVSQRPGKPMWFGVSQKNFVFALPGNPVSTFMCFHRYVKMWLVKSMNNALRTRHAILSKDFSFTPQLTYFLQVKIENDKGRQMAYPMAGGGSGDFANLKDVDGFLELPLEQNEFKAGEIFPVYIFRQNFKNTSGT